MQVFRWVLAGLFISVVNSFGVDVEDDNYQPLLDAWRKPGAAHDAETRNQLIHAARFAERLDVIEEVAAGGDVGVMEIKLPPHPDRIAAKVVMNLRKMPEVPYSGGSMDCVIRRMTSTHFEAWTPARGWLFNSKGQLVNEARPPRRDGRGREWHGAFLPDGRWVTTDLWELDKTLTFFSRSGKWQKEISSAALAPPKAYEGNGRDLIGWARCDRQGKGWVVSIGADGGRAIVYVEPSGRTRRLKGNMGLGTPVGELCDEAWRLCYPRDLEPKGMYVALFRPSDDRKCWLSRNEPGHGTWVGFPAYRWAESERASSVIPNGDSNFGFLPGSRDIFIGSTFRDFSEETEAWPRAPGIHLKTWFFDSAGKCRGWVRAAYLTDSAEGKGMCFCDEDDGVVTLGTDLKLLSRTRFAIAGKTAKPVKLFTDLKMGFFLYDNELVLARW